MEKVKKSQTEQCQSDNGQQDEIVERNLRFYTRGCEVPKDAIKPIASGRLKGKSDVNPMWRMKRLTEIFGPVGFGWRYEIVKQWTEVYGQEIKCFCNVNLYVRDPETKEWSTPIPGSGGSAIVSVERNGPYVDDDAYKKALTDALSIAMKPLGIAANVWYGPKAVAGYEESKYEQPAQPQQSQQQPIQMLAYTGEHLKAALAEAAAATSLQQLQDVWIKWQNSYPAMCGNNTEFYKDIANRIAQFRNTK